MNNVIQTIAQKREIECLVESRALQLRVAPLKKANWFTVVLPALIAGFAGAGLADTKWKTVLGIATLITSLLVVIHKTLNCDAYQTEADRLQRSYRALAVRYRTVFELNPPDSEARLSALEESLAALKESEAADIPDKYRIDAQKLIFNATHSTKAA